MQRAFTFPMTAERSRTKECLEASLAGLCELELRKQRQESLVLGALALGDPVHAQLGHASATQTPPCLSVWGQENLTLRRQLSALQSHPWTLIQTLEQQVGELQIDADAGADTSDSRPSSGFYESSDGHSPKGRSSAEPTETNWTYCNERPKSLGDSFPTDGDMECPFLRTTLSRSFSAPYPPLEGIAEEEGGTGLDPWYLNPQQTTRTWPQHQQREDHPGETYPLKEEEYQQALRVEGYILSVIQRHTLPPRPCQPRTTLGPDPMYPSASLQRRTTSITSELRPHDPYFQSYVDLSGHPNSQIRGCDPSEGEACGGEAPSMEEGCYLALPYPQSRPHSLAGRLPSPLPFVDPNCVAGGVDLCSDPASPLHYRNPQAAIHPNLVNAPFGPRQACHGPALSPRHYTPTHISRPIQTITSPEHQNRSKSSKKTHNECHKAKRSSGKSENSLLGQRVLPERRYSTTERPQARGDPAHLPGNPQACRSNAGRRWCSNLELSQDEGESHTPHAGRRPVKKRTTHQHQQIHHGYPHRQQWHRDHQQRAPLCQEEEATYQSTAPAESESSMSEVYSPASSSLSSDSDESGGLVWPQQLPPRLAVGSGSSSSPSPAPHAAPAGNSSAPQHKAFVKIKASHALKKKILRFRSGSLKVMTTV